MNQHDGSVVEDIVIVGGGIAGLATALALHRKGITSVVLEKSETLRSEGAGAVVKTNGWRALDQLGIGSKLRKITIPLYGARDVWLERNRQQAGPLSAGESRCVKRSDLVEVLAEELPHGTVRFGCHISSVKLDPLTACPVLQLRDGRTLKAKVLIGCDGANSVVAEFLRIKKKFFPKCGVRGLTYYPDGHGLAPEVVRTHAHGMNFGRYPINPKLVFWFALVPQPNPEKKVHRDPKLILETCLENMNGIFPDEIIKIMRDCDRAYLSLTYMAYRAPWHILVGRFREGTVTVAGDAMHVMCPFLGQGTSQALEDAVVLVRCLVQKIHDHPDLLRGTTGLLSIMQGRVGEALDEYVKQRRMKLVGVCAQTYLTGLLMDFSSKPVKLFVVLLLAVVFHDSVRPTRFDCGRL